MPSAANVGAEPLGAAAAAVVTANAYTDASISAITTGAGRAKIATLVSIANLSSVTLNTLDPLSTPTQGDKVLVLGNASPDGVIAASAAYGGLYDVGVVVAGVAPFTRNTNYNTIAEICGASWFVTDGTYSNDFWACTTDPTGAVLNTTPLTFVQIAGALSNNAPQPLGIVAGSGTSHDVSRADHVHLLPTIPGLSNAIPQPLGVANAGTSTDAARADHVHAGASVSDQLSVPGLVSLAGSVVSYSASPAGVSLERGDTSLATRNGIRFWGRGNGKGTIDGNATGLRVTATVTDSTQPYPFADGGTSVFFQLPPLNELEVDLHFNLVLTQKATAGDSVNFRAGLMGFLIAQSYNCGRYALFSFGGVNSGNPTEEWGFNSAVSSTQISTSSSVTRVARLRRRGSVFEVWGGPDTSNLSLRHAVVVHTHAQTPLLLTAGINANGAALVNSYVEMTSLAIRDAWTP